MMLKAADDLRWIGLSQDQKPWLALSVAFFERFLSQIRGGVPADLAWLKAHEWLRAHSPSLSQLWGHQIAVSESTSGQKAGVKIVAQAGSALKKVIQFSWMEGKPVLERAESVATALRQDLKQEQERQLSLLPVKVLQPLFVFVAPSLVGLMGFAFYLCYSVYLSGGEGL